MNPDCFFYGEKTQTVSFMEKKLTRKKSKKNGEKNGEKKQHMRQCSISWWVILVSGEGNNWNLSSGREWDLRRRRLLFIRPIGVHFQVGEIAQIEAAGIDAQVEAQ